MKTKSVTYVRCAFLAIATFASLEVAHADIIYVNDYFGNNVDRYDLATGAYLGTFANSGLNGPDGMAFDGHGNLFVANWSGNFITELTPNGASSMFATGLSTPSGLAFDRTGNLYVANLYGNTIMKFTPDGVGTVFASAGLNGPIGLAFDKDGNLYAANYYGQTIEKFTPTGVGSVFASSGLNYPWGLAFDKGGNLFVANFWGNNIEKFTPEGVGSVFARVYAVSSSLRYLAFDESGNLYATDYDNWTIMKFTPNGIGSVLANLGYPGGMHNPGGIVIQSVPEPSPVGLLSLGILSLMVCSRIGLRRDQGVTHLPR